MNKNDVQQSASKAVSQVINGCVAQHSGHMCRFEGKICSHGRSFTNWGKMMTNKTPTLRFVAASLI
jgi:hypothetical protein